MDSSGDDFVRGAMLGSTVDTGLVTVLGFGRISHIFYVAVDSNPEVFGLHSYAEWSRVLRCSRAPRLQQQCTPPHSIPGTGPEPELGTSANLSRERPVAVHALGRATYPRCQHS